MGVRESHIDKLLVHHTGAHTPERGMLCSLLGRVAHFGTEGVNLMGGIKESKRRNVRGSDLYASLGIPLAHLWVLGPFKLAGTR